MKFNNLLISFFRYLLSYVKYWIPKPYLLRVYFIFNWKKYRSIKSLHKSVFDQSHVMFIHVPKAAGTSITKMLYKR